MLWNNKPPAEGTPKKRPFRLFEQWGGDDKVFRLLQTIVVWTGIAVTAYVIWGGNG